MSQQEEAELELCEHCTQMTNHRDGICLKCKGKPSESATFKGEDLQAQLDNIFESDESWHSDSSTLYDSAVLIPKLISLIHSRDQQIENLARLDELSKIKHPTRAISYDTIVYMKERVEYLTKEARNE